VVTESATGDVIAQVPLDTADAVDRAVAAASAAAQGWGRSSISQRTKVLFAFHALVDAHREELAETRSCCPTPTSTSLPTG
jgi:malonate-semialdehyde dehydrogenase (acetylating) / methylmalonate-semialdehyde dehydrogenase